MRILVTGGAGFIGSHLVDRLVLDSACKVAVFDNFSRGQMEHLALSQRNVQVVRGDIRDRASLQRIMNDVDLVYHLAAQANVLGAVRDSDYAFETNVIGTYEVLRAAASAGVRRVVFSSSREVYGEPTSLPVLETATLAPKNAYGVSKAAGEMYCRLFAACGLEVVVLRLTNVYGPRDRGRVIPFFAEQALSGKPLTVFGHNKILDFLWIDDLIDVLYQASRCPCPDTPINVGSGKGVSLADLATRISALAGGCSIVNIATERLPEVGRFIADVTAAHKLFDYRRLEDPCEYVPLLVEQLRYCMENQAEPPKAIL